MKNLLICFCYFFSIGCLQSSEAQSSSSPMLVRDFLSRLSKSLPTFVFGWEFGSGKSIITDSTALIAAMDKADIGAIAKIIAEQTDYECIIDVNSFVLVPKTIGITGTVLSKRDVVYTEASNLPLGNFLRDIKALDGMGQLRFRSWPDTPVGAVGAITLPAGRDVSYKLINKICRVLKARSWIMQHPFVNAPAGGKISSQLDYTSAYVRFDVTGEFHFIESKASD